MDFKPKEFYKLQCPQDEKYIEDIALYYDPAECCYSPEIVTAFEQLKKLVDDWKARHFKGRIPPRLEAAVTEKGTLVIDTRQCARARMQYITGAEEQALRTCSEAVSPEKLSEKAGEKYSPRELSHACENLIRKKLMISVEGKYLALSVEFSQEELVRREVQELFRMLSNDREKKEQFNAIARHYDNTADMTVWCDIITEYANRNHMYLTGKQYLSIIRNRK